MNALDAAHYKSFPVCDISPNWKDLLMEVELKSTLTASFPASGTNSAVLGDYLTDLCMFVVRSATSTTSGNGKPASEG